MEKTPIQKLMDFMDFNRIGEDGEHFNGECMMEAIRLLEEERRLLVEIRAMGDDCTSVEDAEVYINERFNL